MATDDLTVEQALDYWQRRCREIENSLETCREDWLKVTPGSTQHADRQCGLLALDLIRARLWSDRARDELGQPRVYT